MVPTQDRALGFKGWLLYFFFALSCFVRFEPAPFDMMFCGLLLVWLCFGSLTVSRRLLPMVVTLVPLILLQLLGIITSRDPGESLVAGAVTIYLILVPPVLAALSSNPTWPVAEAMLRGTLLVGVVSSLLCMFAYVGAIPYAEQLMLHARATGGFKDPNVFAAWLVPSFIFAFSSALENPKRFNLYYACAAAICGIGLLLAFSRGAWGHTAVSLFIAYFLQRITPDPEGKWRQPQPVFWICVAIATVGVVAYFSQNDEFMALWELRFGKQDYDQERFSAQRQGWVRGVQSMFGVGPGRVDNVIGMNVHNTYLHVLLETGWISFLSYLGFLGLSIARATRLALSAPLAQDRLYFRIASATLVGVALESWIVDILHWRHFWYIAALAWLPVRQNTSPMMVALYQWGADEKPDSGHGPPKTRVTARIKAPQRSDPQNTRRKDLEPPPKHRITKLFRSRKK